MQIFTALMICSAAIMLSRFGIEIWRKKSAQIAMVSLLQERKTAIFFSAFFGLFCIGAAGSTLYDWQASLWIVAAAGFIFFSIYSTLKK